MVLRKSLALFILGIMMLTLFGSCATNTGSSGPDGTSGEAAPVKLAALFNVTGSGAEVGNINIAALQMAVDYKNAHGGIQSLGGAKIQLVVGDTLSDTTQGKTVAERILADEEIVGVFAASGSAYLTGMLPVFEKLQIPCITHNIGMSIIQSGYEYVFMAASNADNNSKLQTDFLKWLNDNHYGGQLHKVGIVYENSDFGVSSSKSFSQLAQDLGFDVVYNQSFPIGMSDASTLVAGLKASGAEIILPNAVEQDAKLIFDTMDSMDYHPVILGGGAGLVMPNWGRQLGDKVAGQLSGGSSTTWDVKGVADSEEIQAAIKKYREDTGDFPSEHFCGAYANAQIMIAALESSGSRDRTALRDAIKDTHIQTWFTGGPCDFRDDGWNQVAHCVVVQWQKGEDGKYEPRTIYPESDATSSYIPPDEAKDTTVPYPFK